MKYMYMYISMYMYMCMYGVFRNVQCTCLCSFYAMCSCTMYMYILPEWLLPTIVCSVISTDPASRGGRTGTVAMWVPCVALVYCLARLCSKLHVHVHVPLCTCMCMYCTCSSWKYGVTWIVHVICMYIYMHGVHEEHIRVVDMHVHVHV